MPARSRSQRQVRITLTAHQTSRIRKKLPTVTKRRTKIPSQRNRNLKRQKSEEQNAPQLLFCFFFHDLSVSRQLKEIRPPCVELSGPSCEPWRVQWQLPACGS